MGQRISKKSSQPFSCIIQWKSNACVESCKGFQQRMTKSREDLRSSASQNYTHKSVVGFHLPPQSKSGSFQQFCLKPRPSMLGKKYRESWIELSVIYQCNVREVDSFGGKKYLLDVSNVSQAIKTLCHIKFPPLCRDFFLWKHWVKVRLV